MSLIFGFDNTVNQSVGNNAASAVLCSAISTYDALQLAYKKLSKSCEETGEAISKAHAKAMSKANSASYRARKAGETAKAAGEAADEASEASNKALALAKKVDEQCNSSIQTYTKEMEFKNYGEPRIIKSFKRGIVLLGIITTADKNNAGSAGGNVYFDFYDITGSKHMASIRGQQKYEIIKNTDEVSSIKDVYTSPKPCSIGINLIGKDAKSKAPKSPIKLRIIIQYIELSGGNSELESSGMFGK